MYYCTVTIKIEDKEKFWQVFSNQALELRLKHGSKRSIALLAEDESEVTVYYEWESKEKMDAFFADPKVKELVAISGTIPPPQIKVFSKLGELPG